jgi:hypothetical protein
MFPGSPVCHLSPLNIDDEADKALVKVLRQDSYVPGIISDNLCFLQWLRSLIDEFLDHVHRSTYRKSIPLINKWHIITVESDHAPCWTKATSFPPIVISF